MLRRLEDSKDLNFFYLMCNRKELNNYIIASIKVNSKSLNSPYLHNRFNYYNNMDFVIPQRKPDIFGKVEYSLPLDEDALKLEDMPDDKKQLIQKIYNMFKPYNAKRVFGKDWKYLKNLLFEYIDKPKASYRSLGKKYGIHYTSIGRDIRIIKLKILEELQNEKII